MGSLAVTGPTGVEVGAKSKFGVMATEADLLEFGAGNQGYPGVEIGVTAQVAPGGYSGIERQRCVRVIQIRPYHCLLYTSDAADE